MSRLIGCFVLLFLVSSCGYFTTSRQLEEADSLMIDMPDSAYTILQSIDNDALWGSGQRAYYGLLFTQAQHKNYIHISSDSLILRSTLYYQDENIQKYVLSLYYLAVVYDELGYNELAVRTYYQSEEALKKLEVPDTKLEALLNSSIGMLYANQFAGEKAMVRYLTAERLFQSLADTTNLCYLYNLMGNALRMQGELNNALVYYHKSYELATDINNERQINIINNSLAWLYCDMKQFDKVKLLANNVTGKPQLLASMAIHNNQPDSALYYISQAKSYSLIDYHILSQIWMSKGDAKKTYSYYQKYIAANDSLKAARLRVTVDEIKALYDNKRLIEEKERLQDTYSIWITICGGAILALVTLIILLRYKAQKERQEYRNVVEALKTQSPDPTLLSLLNEQEATFRKVIEKRLSLFGELITLSYELTDSRLFAAKFRSLVAEQPLHSDALNDITEVVNVSYNHLIDKLKNDYPSLNKQELLICALSCVGFTSQQLFIILSAKSVEVIYDKKYRINQKLGIKGDLKEGLKDMYRQQ